MFRRIVIIPLYLFSLAITGFTYCQDSTVHQISLQQAVTLALSNNLEIRNARLRYEQSEAQLGEAWQIDPTEFRYMYGQINSPGQDYYLEINQNFGSIPSHIQSYRKIKALTQVQKDAYSIRLKELIAETKSAYQYCQYSIAIATLRQGKTNLYDQLVDIADLRYNKGDISLLEKSLAHTRASEVYGDYLIAADDVVLAENKLQQIIMSSESYRPVPMEPELYQIDKLTDTSVYRGGIIIEYYSQKYVLTKMEEGLARAQYFPEFQAGIFSQEIDDNAGLFGWQVGLAVPLWFPARQSAIKQAKIASEIASNELQIQQQKVAFEIENLLYELNRYFRQIRHYQDVALPHADLLIATAESMLNAEEIDFTAYVEYVSLGFKIREEYYTAINNYNQTALQLEIYGE